MIRRHAELDRTCAWRTGGWFREGGADGGCQALAEMNDKALDIYVAGPRDRGRIYMEGFRAEIRNILRDLNITPTEVICHTVRGREGHIPYDTVWYAYTHGNMPVVMQDILETVTPSELLREVYVEPETRQTDRSPRRYDRPDREAPFRREEAETPPVPGDSDKDRAELTKTRAETVKTRAETVKTVVETVLKIAGAFFIAFVLLRYGVPKALELFGGMPG